MLFGLVWIDQNYENSTESRSFYIKIAYNILPTKNRERPALPIVVYKVPKNWFSKFHGEMDIRQVHQGFYSFLDKIFTTFVLFSK